MLWMSMKPIDSDDWSLLKNETVVLLKNSSHEKCLEIRGLQKTNDKQIAHYLHRVLFTADSRLSKVKYLSMKVREQ